jgi:hypothetical protein
VIQLRFRNITASVDDPVETWPFEGIVAAVERGTLLRLGTSRTRLSTYMSGRVTPSAALMLRMRRAATQARATHERQQGRNPAEPERAAGVFAPASDGRRSGEV